LPVVRVVDIIVNAWHWVVVMVVVGEQDGTGKSEGGEGIRSVYDYQKRKLTIYWHRTRSMGSGGVRSRCPCLDLKITVAVLLLCSAAQSLHFTLFGAAHSTSPILF
jgi:hypothetical protein